MIVEAALSLACAVSFEVAETSSSQMRLDYGAPPIGSETTTMRPADGQAFVELGAENRIRLPRQLVSGRDEGWRALRDVASSDTAIIAKFTFAPTVNGTININRMTGEIRVRWGNFLWGSRSMDGDCRPYEQPTTRLF